MAVNSGEAIQGCPILGENYLAALGMWRAHMADFLRHEQRDLTLLVRCLCAACRGKVYWKAYNTTCVLLSWTSRCT